MRRQSSGIALDAGLSRQQRFPRTRCDFNPNKKKIFKSTSKNVFPFCRLMRMRTYLYLNLHLSSSLTISSAWTASHFCHGSKSTSIASQKSQNIYPSVVSRVSGWRGGVQRRGSVLPLIILSSFLRSLTARSRFPMPYATERLFRLSR